MKKHSILFIGIVIVVISGLSEVVLSKIETEKWSNYTHSWETKWTTSVKHKPARKVNKEKATFRTAKIIKS
jgi:hypothetical protein